MAEVIQRGPHVTPAVFLLIYQLCASVFLCNQAEVCSLFHTVYLFSNR